MASNGQKLRQSQIEWLEFISHLLVLHDEKHEEQEGGLFGVFGVRSNSYCEHDSCSSLSSFSDIFKLITFDLSVCWDVITLSIVVKM